jgi:hypothetical protein
VPTITNTIVDTQGNPIQSAKVTVQLQGDWYVDGSKEVMPSFVWSTITDSIGSYAIVLPPQSTYQGSTYYVVREPGNVTHAFTLADSPSNQRLRDRLTTPVSSQTDIPLKLDDLSDVVSSTPPSGAFLTFNGVDWVPLTVIPGGNNFFVYNQTSPAGTWVINHNLNRYPNVTLFDNTNTLFLTDIIYSSLNVVTVVNSVPITGTAILE